VEHLTLLGLPTSPYSARVQIQLYEKVIDLCVEHPSGGVGVNQKTTLNPFGKTPILMVGQERIIESAAIQEYLEDVYPLPSLRGADFLTTARMRAFVRAVDLYLFPIIHTLRGLEAGTDDVPDAMEDLRQVIDKLQKLFGNQAYICGGKLTLADCTLVPACFYLERFLALHGQESIFVGRPVLQNWWDTVRQHRSVSQVIAQLEEAVNKGS